MPEMPDVKSRGWVHVGGMLGFDAVVCSVHPEELKEHAGDIEAVYLDERDRAINVNLRWSGTGWVFAQNQTDGGYADKYDRLKEYVQILRRGRYR